MPITPLPPINPDPFIPYDPIPNPPNPDYVPPQESYSGQSKFRFWCQKVMPLVYDDSLSYYELLCKVVNYLNNTIQDVANMETNVTALLNSFAQLQDYVNNQLISITNDVNTSYQSLVNYVNSTYKQLTDYVNQYFSSLDVQEEIDNKLDEMVLSGQFLEIISPLIETEVSKDVTKWLNDHVTPPGSVVLLDKSLTIEGAAADAKATGDMGRKINSQIPDYIPLTFIEPENGKYINGQGVKGDGNFFLFTFDVSRYHNVIMEAYCNTNVSHDGGNPNRFIVFFDPDNNVISATEWTRYAVVPMNATTASVTFNRMSDSSIPSVYYVHFLTNLQSIVSQIPDLLPLTFYKYVNNAFIGLEGQMGYGNFIYYKIPLKDLQGNVLRAFCNSNTRPDSTRFIVFFNENDEVVKGYEWTQEALIPETATEVAVTFIKNTDTSIPLMRSVRVIKIAETTGNSISTPASQNWVTSILDDYQHQLPDLIPLTGFEPVMNKYVDLEGNEQDGQCFYYKIKVDRFRRQLMETINTKTVVFFTDTNDVISGSENSNYNSVPTTAAFATISFNLNNGKLPSSYYARFIPLIQSIKRQLDDYLPLLYNTPIQGKFIGADGQEGTGNFMYYYIDVSIYVGKILEAYTNTGNRSNTARFIVFFDPENNVISSFQWERYAVVPSNAAKVAVTFSRLNDADWPFPTYVRFVDFVESNNSIISHLIPTQNIGIDNNGNQVSNTAYECYQDVPLRTSGYLDVSSIGDPYPNIFVTYFDENNTVVKGYTHTQITKIPPEATHVSITFIKNTNNKRATHNEGFIPYFETFKKINPTNIITKPSLYSTVYISKKAKTAALNIQIDDGTDGDTTVHDILNQYGIKCGFSLVPPSLMGDGIKRYTDYYKEGYELIAHSMDYTPMSGSDETVEAIREKMYNSKKRLEAWDVEIRGWTTPSSLLNQKYQGTVESIFDYATTLSPVNNTTETPYNIKSDGPFKIKRMSMEKFTPSEIIAAIEQTIENKGMISLYGYDKRK